MAAQQATGAVPAATRLPTVQLCFDRRNPRLKPRSPSRHGGATRQLCFDRRNPRLKHLVDAHAGDPVG